MKFTRSSLGDSMLGVKISRGEGSRDKWKGRGPNEQDGEADVGIASGTWR